VPFVLGFAVLAIDPAAFFGMISEYDKALEQVEGFVSNLQQSEVVSAK
jgi:hypothetical protein